GYGTLVVLDELHVGADIIGFLHQRAQVGHGRLGEFADRGAEHSDDLTQVLERLVGAFSDHLRRPTYLVLRGVRAKLQSPRVHAQHRQSVPEYIVDLPGDGLTDLVLSLLGAQACLTLGVHRPVTQRRQQLATVMDGDPPTGECRLYRDAQKEHHKER